MDIDSRISAIVESFKSSGKAKISANIKVSTRKLKASRQLEILDPTSCKGGDTNFIMVDRENILETEFEEILALKDKFTTLEV